MLDPVRRAINETRNLVKILIADCVAYGARGFELNAFLSVRNCQCHRVVVGIKVLRKAQTSVCEVYDHLRKRICLAEKSLSYSPFLFNASKLGTSNTDISAPYELKLFAGTSALDRS